MKEYKLVYEPKDENSITVFIDASFPTAKEDEYQSTSWYLIFSHEDLIEWGTKKQAQTVISTSAAEYVGLNDATKSLLFMKDLNKKLLKCEEELAIIYEDNKSAINIAKSTESKESRFLLTKYYAIQ